MTKGGTSSKQVINLLIGCPSLAWAPLRDGILADIGKKPFFRKHRICLWMISATVSDLTNSRLELDCYKILLIDGLGFQFIDRVSFSRMGTIEKRNLGGYGQKAVLSEPQDMPVE
ncbi:hypothetical protein CDAR_90261 [Caerostris darwini]|uniref:Uncharacterized protein n=1 Tax=Caerostris darwini TaxID=1538125 RepID=A0AAV4NR65_9ARAC|nr:hypothetical protein CDAR_90261 [Caerostris darwini]